MGTRSAGSFLRVRRFCALLFIMIIFLQVMVGCDASSPTNQPASQVQQTPLPASAATHVSALPPPPVPTPTLLPQALHGPANFLLNNPFKFSNVSGTVTDASGTTTQLSSATLKTAVANDFKHILFVADHNDMVKVYSPGATTPTATAVTQLSDGSTVIQYTQVLGSVTITFDSRLSGNQLNVTFQQQYDDVSTVNGQQVRAGKCCNSHVHNACPLGSGEPDTQSAG